MPRPQQLQLLSGHFDPTYGDPTFKPGPPPKEAVKWLAGKKVKPAANWQDTWAQEYRYAFFVAKMTEKDLLKDVQDSLTDAVENGVGFREWADDIESTFDESGWSDYHGAAADNPARLRTVYDTNMRTARAAGELERQQRVKELFPYAESNLGPSKVHREEHEEWEGMVVRVDGPWFQAHVYPCGFGCKCFWRYIMADEAQELLRGVGGRRRQQDVVA